MKELKAKINRVYENIQNLQLQPSKSNTMLLADCFMLLEEVYNSMPDEVSKLDLDKDREEPEEAEKAEEADEA